MQQEMVVVRHQAVGQYISSLADRAGTQALQRINTDAKNLHFKTVSLNVRILFCKLTSAERRDDIGRYGERFAIN